MMKKIISSVLFLCLISTGYGKEYTYTSTVQTPYPKGYQKVDLNPQVLGLLQPNYADLRLLDSNQNEVPYILRKETKTSMHRFFKEYPILINQPAPNGTSVIVFENPDKEEINQFNFVVKNTAVNKSARLSGSNDQKNWFLIRDHISLHAMHNSQNTTELKLLNFPLVDYSYFKLEVNDSNSLPIQFEKVGYYDYQSVNGSMTTTPLQLVSVRDSNKITYTHLKYNSSTRTERMRVLVSGPEFYYRKIHFKIKRTSTNRKGKTKMYWDYIGTYYLDSNTENIFDLGGQNLKDVYVEIENGDDQPLKIETIESYLLKNYLVAELDSSMTYAVVFGNPKARSPKYDLRHFANNIPEDLPVVKMSEMFTNKEKQTSINSNHWLDNKYLIWTIIAVVGMVLAFISFSMIKEMGKKEKETH